MYNEHCVNVVAIAGHPREKKRNKKKKKDFRLTPTEVKAKKKKKRSHVKLNYCRCIEKKKCISGVWKLFKSNGLNSKRLVSTFDDLDKEILKVSCFFNNPPKKKH